MRRSLSLLCAASVLAAAVMMGVRAEEKATPRPLKALLVIGGCCHDYASQKEILKAGIEQRANIIVDVEYSEDTSTKARFPLYEQADWAAGYDVVIHDECSADVKEKDYVGNILQAHREGVPAVNLHCAMHSYRTGDDQWFEFVGLQSSSHGPQLPIAIEFADRNHPVTAGLEDWTTIKEELYNNLKIWDTARPLARGRQGDGDEVGKTNAVVAWINHYGPKKTRVFSTTLGHNNETVADDRYLDLITRGVLWAAGRLEDDGQPAKGYAPPTAGGQ